LAPEELEQQRLGFALEQGITASYVGMAATLILAMAAAPGTGAVPAAAWAFLMLTILLLRSRILRRGIVLLQHAGGTAPVRKDFTVSSLVLSLTMARCRPSVSLACRMELRMVLTVFLCCWCCAAMASLGVSPRLYTAYLCSFWAGWPSAGPVRACPKRRTRVAALVLYTLVLRAFS
jgi:hypothetical protein